MQRPVVSDDVEQEPMTQIKAVTDVGQENERAAEYSSGDGRLKKREENAAAEQKEPRFHPDGLNDLACDTWLSFRKQKQHH
jgi:hypothetical protein